MLPNKDKDNTRVLRPSMFYTKKLGLNESIVLSELVYRQKKAKKFIGKKKWFFTEIISIYEDKNKKKLPPLNISFPWLSPAGIYKIIQKLKKFKLILTGNFNSSKNNHTTWYRVHDEVIYKVNCSHKYQLSISDIILHGTSSALLLNYIEYELIKYNKKELLLSPDRLIHVLPFSESTIKRAIQNLLMAKKITKTNKKSHYRITYTNPLTNKICGKTKRKFTYYSKEDKLIDLDKYLKDNTSYSDSALPVIGDYKDKLKKILNIPITNMNNESAFEEAAHICYKHEYDPEEYAKAQFEGSPVKIPTLLIEDTAEQKYLNYKELSSKGMEPILDTAQ